MSASATVVIIDAHDDSRSIYAAVLEHHGYRVLASACRDEGAQLLDAGGVRLACVALTPLAGGGLGTMEPLRKKAAAAGIPLLALGTTSGDEIRRRATAAGCAGYLLKPCRPLELLAEVRRILDGAQ